MNISLGKMYPNSLEHSANILRAIKKVLPEVEPGKFLYFRQIGVHEEGDRHRINSLLDIIYNSLGRGRQERVILKNRGREMNIFAYPKEGKDITLVAYSNMLFKALEAANELEKDGISCEVVDPRTLVPLDINTIFNSVKKTGHLVIITEACERGSVASDISAKVGDIIFDYLDAPVKIVACPNSPIPYNSKMEQSLIPGKDRIIKVIKEIL